MSHVQLIRKGVLNTSLQVLVSSPSIQKKFSHDQITKGKYLKPIWLVRACTTTSRPPHIKILKHHKNYNCCPILIYCEITIWLLLVEDICSLHETGTLNQRPLTQQPTSQCHNVLSHVAPSADEIEGGWQLRCCSQDPGHGSPFPCTTISQRYFLLFRRWPWLTHNIESLEVS